MSVFVVTVSVVTVTVVLVVVVTVVDVVISEHFMNPSGQVLSLSNALQNVPMEPSALTLMHGPLPNAQFVHCSGSTVTVAIVVVDETVDVVDVNDVVVVNVNVVGGSVITGIVVDVVSAHRVYPSVHTSVPPSTPTLQNPALFLQGPLPRLHSVHMRSSSIVVVVVVVSSRQSISLTLQLSFTGSGG